jgi:basic membrane protein A and related proteins
MDLDQIARARLNRRRLVGTALAIPAIAAFPASLRLTSAQDAISATMVTDTNGLGDQNFNDLADKGGKQAASEFGVDWKVIESADSSQYVPNMTAAAEQSDLSVGVGYLLEPALTSVAEQNPDKKFLLIDSVSDAPNVRSITFKEQEGAYLAGVVAGLTTKTNKLGFVGGQKIPPVIRYQVGFQAGVKSVNPDAEVIISYVNSFDDIQLGKELTLAQFNQGADIVFPAAGRSGIGSYEAVKEKGPGYWVIGADVDQDHLAPGLQLVVAQKGVDTAVYNTIKEVVDDQFQAGAENLGIKEGFVSLQTPGNRVPDDILAVANGYQKAIIDGTIVPPTTEEELAAFQVPAQPSPVPVASPEGTPTS